MKRWLAPDGYLLEMLEREVCAALDRCGCGANSQVVDIGCGKQPYRGAVEARGAHYVGCDLAEGPHVQLVPGERLPLPEASFDIGLSIQVLEHVWDLDEYLGRFRTHLRPKGRLVLSTHGNWPYHPHPADFRRWTRQGLCAELEHRGFWVESIMPLMGPLAWTTQFRLLGASRALGSGSLAHRALAPLFVLGNAWMRCEDALTPRAIAQDNACVYLVVCSLADEIRAPEASRS